MAGIQQTLASQASFEKYGRKSKRELFLDQMNQVVPWSELLALVEPHYPKAGNGRQPVGVAIMLRTYFLQQWFKLSDPGMEEAFYESAVLRRFAGVDLGVAAAPDETTILRFRHLLEAHDLGGEMLDTVNLYLETKGIRISTGTIVDATIIQAPSSTKNSTGERDPEMHQTKKGKQWYFGAKAHIGVDSKETVVHSLCTSAASVADKHMLPDLLHGEERKVWGDGAYQGQREAIHAAAPKAQDMTCRRTRYKNYVDEQAKRKNTTKARVRAKVEHPFRILKRVFGFTKVRYRGIWKNHQWLCAAFALMNLYQPAPGWPRKGRSVSRGRKMASQRRKCKQQTHIFPQETASQSRNHLKSRRRCKITHLRRGSFACIDCQDRPYVSPVSALVIRMR